MDIAQTMGEGRKRQVGCKLASGLGCSPLYEQSIVVIRKGVLYSLLRPARIRGEHPN